MSCADEAETDDASTIKLREWEDAIVEISFKDDAGKYIDLTNVPIYATARMRYEDPVPIFYKRSLAAGGSNAEIVAEDQTTRRGFAQLFVDSADLAPPRVDANKSPFVWDTWIVIAGKKRPGIKEGKIIFKKSATRFGGQP